MRLHSAPEAEIGSARGMADSSNRVTRRGVLPSPHSRAGVIAMLVMIIMTIYFLLPVWFLLVSATKATPELYTSSAIWFSHFNLLNQIAGLFEFSNGIYGSWLVNSAIYSIVGSFFAVVFATGGGYVLAKRRFRGSEAIFSVILGGVLVPSTALVLPLYLVMSNIHLTNTYWSVLLPSMVSPFGVYLARVYATSAVPDELIEAARVDGASELRIFSTIVVPIMMPALVTIFLFQFVGIWNNFFLPLAMLSNDKLFPVTLGLYGWTTQYSQEPGLIGYVIIGAAISVVPLIVAFVSLQRFWRGGLTEGSVKS